MFTKVAKYVFGDRSNGITETFLFAKLHVQMENEFAITGKNDASIEEIRTSLQRRCQYAQLIPTTPSAQPFNHVSETSAEAPARQSTRDQPQQSRDVRQKFVGQCPDCDIQGHKWAKCKKCLREQNQTKSAKPNQQLPLPS